MKKQVNGKLVDLTQEELDEFKAQCVRNKDEGYKQARIDAYGDWRPQLEALYDDVASGMFGDLAKKGKFASLIDSVKLTCPKEQKPEVEDWDALDEITKEVFGLKEEVRDA